MLCSDSNEYVDEVFDKCADSLPEVIIATIIIIKKYRPWTLIPHTHLHYQVHFSSFPDAKMLCGFLSSLFVSISLTFRFLILCRAIKIKFFTKI